MNNSKTFLGTEPVGSLLLRLALPTVAAFASLVGHGGAPRASISKNRWRLWTKTWYNSVV